MTTAEELATAILKGDEQAVWPLIDHLMETKDIKRLPALKTLNVDTDRLRMIVFVDPELGGDVEFDMSGVERRFQDWIAGKVKTMGFVGISRIEFYEVPATRVKTVEQEYADEAATARVTRDRMMPGSIGGVE